MKQINVTIFGDSVAKGLKLVNGKPEKLKTNAVEIIAKELKINIDNQSCFGQTITRLLNKNIIENYINKLNKQQKNIVVFSIGGNDCDFDWKYVSEHFNETIDCKTPSNLFIQTYNNIIKNLLEKKVKVYVCGLPPVSAELFFNNYICKLGNGDNVLKYFHNDISNIIRHQEMYNNLIKEIAVKNKIPFLDIRTPFLKVRNLPYYYAEDGIHLNEEGHKLIAENLVKYFKSN